MEVDLDLGYGGYVGQGHRSKVKVICQKCVFTSLSPCFKFKVKGRVKVKGQGQGHRSRLIFWCAAVDNRGSALPSAEKGNRSHYQFKVFVCVSLITGHMRIIARMRSICVLISFPKLHY